MELKKWMAVIVVGLDVTGGLMVRGADPVTMPATPAVATPAAVTPAATPAPGVAPAAVDNSQNGRGGRNGRRGRGNRDSTGSTLLVSSLASDPYAILKTRSIFVKGNQTIAGDTGPTNYTPPSGVFRGAQEAQLVFNGVIFSNGVAVALVEDLSSQNVANVRSGDAIAGGRVSGITLDDLAYEVRGKTLHVSIGQNLQGETASYNTASAIPAVPTSMPTAGTAGGPVFVPPTGGVVPNPGTSTAGMSTDDVLARMRAKRLQESSGK